MAIIPYKVYLIVDREFGEKIAELERGVPVWIVDTPTNKPVVQRLRKESPKESHQTVITTFNDVNSSSVEDILLAELDTIDLHHGSWSANPPYTVIEVVGAQLTRRIEDELSAYGFDDFYANPMGFTATRPEPSD